MAAQTHILDNISTKRYISRESLKHSLGYFVEFGAKHSQGSEKKVKTPAMEPRLAKVMPKKWPLCDLLHEFWVLLSLKATYFFQTQQKNLD